jgi:type III pantothenate kinase
MFETLKVPPVDRRAPVVVIDIGNTNITLGTWDGDRVLAPRSVARGSWEAFVEALEELVRSCPRGRPAAVCICSVVPETLERVAAHVAQRWGKDALVVGQRVPLPIDVGVRDQNAIGTDRVCAAAAVYDRLRTGCTVVNFGTAVTVDLVDDDGVLVGGAILPGPHLQLRALHEFTAQLPLVEPAFPDQPWGPDTDTAIQIGVCRGLAGAVRGIVEGYATALNRWPHVVATGGYVEFMAPHCDFLDTVATHLVLRGAGIACTRHLAGRDDGSSAPQ